MDWMWLMEQYYHYALLTVQDTSGISLGMRPANEMLHCNDISHWLGAELDWTLTYIMTSIHDTEMVKNCNISFSPCKSWLTLVCRVSIQDPEAVFCEPQILRILSPPPGVYSADDPHHYPGKKINIIGYVILVTIAGTAILVPYLLTHWPLGGLTTVSN